MIGTSTRGTPGAPLGRLSTALLALACTGALAAGCAPDNRHPAAPSPPGAPPSAAPVAEAPGGSPPAGPTAGVPLSVLAVADPPRAAVPAPSPGPAGRPAGSSPRRGADRPSASAPPPPRAAHPRAHPAPGRPPHGSPGICALGEQYGGWAAGSSQDASCHAVYG
nr:hypothetical protein [Streptomyces sp. 846.5]